MTAVTISICGLDNFLLNIDTNLDLLISFLISLL